MQTTLGHIQVNIDAANAAFYRDLMTFLGWKTIADDGGFLGYGAGSGPSVWYTGGASDHENDYDGKGMNHIAFSAASQADVDAVAAYIAERGVPALFDTPQHRPDFVADPAQTYYQVMFESPDRILVEVVYTGPKQ